MPHWNELFKRGELVLDEPHPAAVRFVGQLQPDSLVLDHGCGAGRHLVPLLQAGHRVVGIDLAADGLRLARARMEPFVQNRAIPLSAASMLYLPFADESFDALLTINVINHGTFDEMQRAWIEIHRVLKPGGLCSALVISDEDHRCGRGTRLEERTWVPTEGKEAGIPHHYSNKDDLLEFLGKCDWRNSEYTLLKKQLGVDAEAEQDAIPKAWGAPVEVVAHWEVVLVK